MIKYRKVTNAGVTIGAASVSVLVANESRKRVIIVNSHATQSVWLSLGATAVVGQGIYLAPNGGSFEIAPDEVWTGQILGIASGAGTIVGVVELS